MLRDFQSSCLQVADAPYDEETVSSIPMVHYEFPNGYHQVYQTLYQIQRMKISKCFSFEKILSRILVQSVSRYPRLCLILAQLKELETLCWEWAMLSRPVLECVTLIWDRYIFFDLCLSLEFSSDGIAYLTTADSLRKCHRHRWQFSPPRILRPPE